MTTARRRKSLIVGIAAFAVVAASVALISWAMLGADADDPTATNLEPTVAEKVALANEVCSAPEAAAPVLQQFAQAPESSSSGVVVFTFETNCGPLVIESDADASPVTTASFEFLAAQGYFDGTTCHRLTTAGIYVVQCGDPLGTGTGGPGYQFEDENLPEPVENNYPAGTVAMANAGPGTNGSQFFIVYQDTTLPPAYTIWGFVREGMPMIKAVAAKGVIGGGGDGPLNQPLQLQSVSVS